MAFESLLKIIKFLIFFSKRPPQRSSTPSNIICRKCGKAGHYANKCWTKKKLNEITDEGLRKQLIAVLLNSSDEESENEENSNLEVDDIESSSSSKKSSNSEAECNCNIKQTIIKLFLKLMVLVLIFFLKMSKIFWKILIK